MAKESTSAAPGKLDDALAYTIHRTARLLRYSLLHFFKRNGLDITPEQWFMLYRLWEEDKRPQFELADPAIDDRPNITRLIDSLEKRGLVERQGDPDDRRRFLIALTPEAHKLLKELMPKVIEERERLFGSFSEGDLRALTRILKKVEKIALE
ncbi:MAG: MarR family winged helix-turn-helix transcriptional regulator [Candidatus Kapaibacterium sp.]